MSVFFVLLLFSVIVGMVDRYLCTIQPPKGCSALFLLCCLSRASLHCCYQIPSRTVTSATQLNGLPSTLRLGVALSSQRVIRMLPCQCFPILQLCPQSQGLPTRAPTRVTICHPPYHSRRGQPPIICTAWQLLRISGTPNPSFNADFHSLISVRLQSA